MGKVFIQTISIHFQRLASRTKRDCGEPWHHNVAWATMSPSCTWLTCNYPLGKSREIHHRFELISVSFQSHIMKRCRGVLHTGVDLKILGVLGW